MKLLSIKTLLERKYYDKKLEILQDNGNVKRRKLIDSLNYDRTLSVIAEIKIEKPICTSITAT